MTLDVMLVRVKLRQNNQQVCLREVQVFSKHCFLFVFSQSSFACILSSGDAPDDAISESQVDQSKSPTSIHSNARSATPLTSSVSDPASPHHTAPHSHSSTHSVASSAHSSPQSIKSSAASSIKSTNKTATPEQPSDVKDEIHENAYADDTFASASSAVEDTAAQGRPSG